MKYIKNVNIMNQKVILRLDLNVPIQDNVILDKTKIEASIPTIKYLLERNCCIMILSHLGKIKSEEDKKKNSLRLVAVELEKKLNQKICFIDNPIDESIPNILNSERIVLVENTRYMDYPEKKESGCNLKLSQFWASAGELFINDAFGTSHRKHASNYGITRFLPSVYGLLIEKEIQGLKPIIEEVKTPFSVIMGGAKVDDKISLIKAMLNKCDYLLVGGGIANTFLKAKGYNIGQSIYSEKELDNVISLIDIYLEKIVVPLDVAVLNGNGKYIREIEEINDDDIIYDIGPKTINIYKEQLEKSKTVFLNGTVGLYEHEEFAEGTKKILEIIGDLDAVTVAGGGDALSSINKFKCEKNFDYLSTGGGATLDYISSGKIECFEE